MHYTKDISNTPKPYTHTQATYAITQPKTQIHANYQIETDYFRLSQNK